MEIVYIEFYFVTMDHYEFEGWVERCPACGRTARVTTQEPPPDVARYAPHMRIREAISLA